MVRTRRAVWSHLTQSPRLLLLAAAAAAAAAAAGAAAAHERYLGPAVCAGGVFDAATLKGNVTLIINVASF
jgi:hypothetical protein